MNNFTAAAAFVVTVGFAGAVSAGQAGQTPMPAGTEPTRDTTAKHDTMKMDTMKPMTVTGCVAETGGMFTLDHAMTAADMKKMSAADMKAGSHMMSYMLMGGELKAHVGHKVEVTGTVAPGMAADKPAGTQMSADKSGSKDSMGMMKGGTLNVKSVKMVSATCP